MWHYPVLILAQGMHTSTIPGSCDKAVMNTSCYDEACYAIFYDQTATVWGKSSLARALGPAVEHIVCNSYACTALFASGKVEAWGDAGHGGDVGSIVMDGIGDARSVSKIACSDYACAAQFVSGAAATWGLVAAYAGAPMATLMAQAKTMDGSSPTTSVVDLSCGNHACVARFADGSGAAWGDARFGGDPAAAFELYDDSPVIMDASSTATTVEDISCGRYACVVRFANGFARAWGGAFRGGRPQCEKLECVGDFPDWCVENVKYRCTWIANNMP